MRSFTLLSLLLLMQIVVAQAENWPRFRGPTGQGISKEKNLPTEWSATSNVRWKTAIPGAGWSSPIVWEDRVFVTTATDSGVLCRVICLNRESGEVLWNQDVFRQVPLRKQRKNSYASPTPVTDGERVYAVFADGSFVALRFDGEKDWEYREVNFYSDHGLGASPILYEDLVIMSFDGSSRTGDKKVGWQIPWDKSYILALDKNTGEVRWKAKRGMSRIAHVTPLIVRKGDQTQLISSAGDVIQGFDLQTGERLWTVRNEGEGVVPSFVIGNGMVFTTSGFGDPTIRATRLWEEGEDTRVVWEQTRGVPMEASLLYLEPHLYSIRGAVATCYEAKTGNVVWEERIGGNHSASPVYADGKIYFLSEEGEGTVIEAGEEFKIVAQNPINEKCQASYAVSQGNLFIRSAENLYCIGE